MKCPSCHTTFEPERQQAEPIKKRHRYDSGPIYCPACHTQLEYRYERRPYLVAVLFIVGILLPVPVIAIPTFLSRAFGFDVVSAGLTSIAVCAGLFYALWRYVFQAIEVSPG